MTVENFLWMLKTCWFSVENPIFLCQNNTFKHNFFYLQNCHNLFNCWISQFYHCFVTVSEGILINYFNYIVLTSWFLTVYPKIFNVENFWKVFNNCEKSLLKTCWKSVENCWKLFFNIFNKFKSVHLNLFIN